MDALQSLTSEPATLISLATFCLVLLAIVVFLWHKFAELSGGQKTTLIAAGSLATMVVLWVAFPEQANATGLGWSTVSAVALDLWRRWDGFARANPLIGLILLAAIPFLLLPERD